MATAPRVPKRILSDEEAMSKIDQGVELVSRIVGMTMGPKGWNVAIRLGANAIGEGKVITTKDGVFVANQITHPDPEVDLGVEMAVETSRKTNDGAGDGTTCTVVLLNALLQEARKHVKVGSNSIRIQDGMHMEKDLVLDLLAKMTKPVTTEEEVYNVALVSCQDKDIAKKIADIILDVGKYGTVSVEAMTGPHNIDLRVQRGMYFDFGYDPRLTSLTAASIVGQMQRKGNTTNLSWNNDDVGVLIFDEPVRTWADVAPIFEACVASDRRKLLIIGDFQDDATIGLLAQYQQGIVTGCVIPRGVFSGDVGREVLKDIAIFTGARFLAPTEGTMPKKNAAIDANEIDAILGSCVANVSRDTFTLVSGRGKQEEIDARIALIEELIEKGGLNDYDKQKYRERIARFRAGIGTITIFAPTEIQQQSIRTRVDDAVCAVRSANEEGIVAGGGVALLRCYQHLMVMERQMENKDVEAGRMIVRNSLLQPARRIAEVAGEDAGVRIAQLQKHPKESTMGYDYWTETECDLLKQGIIDPKKVVRLCVENAVSQAGELLRTRVTIVDTPGTVEPEVQMTPRERALSVHQKRIAQG